ncbi:hypothetical protein MKW94_015629 [Papaver nudicaule]|uniref:Uncharacterized protein n=1 Tax=Papaver nudicaule TaxID=74823 RepID=A0AA41SE66_PAPNU|nr:hypothetical protein [Papaver nudicaule]
MGCSLNKQARRKKPCGRKTFVRALTEKIILLEEDMSEITRKRGKESEVKHSGWEFERKRLREEIKKLRKESEEKDVRIQRLMENTNYYQHNIMEWEPMGASYNHRVMEHMREEQLRREEAIEKWKRLYLAIKTELDDLIERTCRETIAVLKARLAAIEEEGRKMKTEVDILRQTSRIMSHAKRTKNVTKRTLALVKINQITKSTVTLRAN